MAMIKKRVSTIIRFLKREGFPKEGYRFLCSNCNHSLGIHGYCPHRRERENQLCAD
jgi:hypothetical protein